MKINVLNIDSIVDPVTGGGTGERTVQMSRFVQNAGAECTILTLSTELTFSRASKLPGVTIEALPCLSKRFNIPKIGYRLIRRIVADADVIHLMGHWTVLNAVVYLFARQNKKPYVVCPAGALPIFGRSRKLKKLYNILVGNRIIRNANAHVAITSEERLHFKPFGISADKVVVIPNGVDASEFDERDDKSFRAKYGLSDLPIILFMGRLNPIKGPDLLLESFCNLAGVLRDYQLIFAGPDNGMLGGLQNTVMKYGLGGQVRFLGYLGGRDKSMSYHAAELLVVPSRQEAMSIVVLEAGITGTPVLITDQCGFNEISVIKGGLVVPASVAGLENGLLAMLSDRESLQLMGSNLMEYVRKNFLWENVVNRYTQLYSGVVASKSKFRNVHVSKIGDSNAQ